jgi:hypothetical protein
MALQRVFKKCNCGCGKNLTTTCLALDTLPEYSSYISAKMRCTNLNNDDFKQYGGRGIEFRFNSFEEFFAEAGHRPAGMTIDRKDKNKHYEVGNVRWATAKVQNANRRKFQAIENHSDVELLAEVRRRGLTL